jgi:hypothetical protein
METKNIKAQRTRSPNYPYYDLRECVAFLEKLYKKYGINEVHIEDAITQFGHSPTSSTANRVIASMINFGLLDSRGTKDNKFVRPTRLAQEILLEKEESPHRIELLQEAAKKDSSMQEIWEKWGPNIPPEDTIKRILQLEMKYSPDGAKRFASTIIGSYDYARISDISQKKTGDDAEEGNKPLDDTEEKLPSYPRKANLLLPGSGREVQISVPSNLSNEEFEYLLKWLEFQKFGLVNKPDEQSME